jgi:PhnB protein
MNIPNGHQVVMPYLILDNPEAFIPFVQKAFNAEEVAMYRTDDGRIMHAEIRIAGTTMMFGSSSKEWPAQTGGFYMYVENADAAFKKALDSGATVVMKIENKDYGRSGGVKDPCGNTWWLTQILKSDV